MLAPSTTGGLSPSNSVREQVTEIDRSATASRRVRKTVASPCLRLSWATCPSTHTTPSLSTYWAMAFATARTGAGDSSEVSRREGTGVSLGEGDDRTWLPGAAPVDSPA